MVCGDARSVAAYPGRDRLGFVLSESDVLKRAYSAGPLQVLFVGNVIARKGLHWLINGLSLVPPAIWKLTVVGNLRADPCYVREIKDQVSRCGLDRVVTLIGALSDSDLFDRMSQSHVLAVPSSFEGFGIVYLEGMGLGMPAIGAAAGGAGEIMKHGTNGFLVEPADTKAIAEHIRELATDRDRLAKMSHAALTTFGVFPTWHETGQTIRRFLLETGRQ